jgi:DNA-binding transcriptional ArsR family regulator
MLVVRMHSRKHELADRRLGGEVDVAATASLFADPARAVMIMALLDGGEHAISELAMRAAVAPSTASEHLARLREAGFVAIERRGRVRYVRLAKPDVLDAFEALARISPTGRVRSLRSDERRRALAHARLCYDHLAGELGVALFDALVRVGAVRPLAVPKHARKVHAGLGDVVLGPQAARFFGRFGIDVDDVAQTATRRFAVACLDWSHNQPHLAGALGSALREEILRREWCKKRSGTRALSVTTEGRAAFARDFNVTLS